MFCIKHEFMSFILHFEVRNMHYECTYTNDPKILNKCSFFYKPMIQFDDAFSCLYIMCVCNCLSRLIRVIDVLCFTRFCVCSLLPCGPAAKGLTSWLLLVLFNCIFVTLPYGILGQMWYLIIQDMFHVYLNRFEFHFLRSH